ncbi:cupin domain-containing protein [Microbacterium ulmi]|uniref:Cupin domain-containing protein n=1 Tax=Microbacterium ulmi TaxID=179095 RepID=A0A7Y2LXL0_9MICO|nr:cupin domain-containing protein [Microbacterium ulmi]NII71155.1 mannose-6-phosphate isomerase-like protein (cupin superfamily) [Microbacterium ulmi]NNH02462.1 cupin domain-containing protein [Microbacterium ulmi]
MKMSSTEPISPSVAERELDPGGAFVLAEWTADAPAGAAREFVAPVHIHHEDDEGWYVLEGTMGFLLDGVGHVVPAGGAACARAGVAHTYWNEGPGPARYLLVMTPRIRALIAALHDEEIRSARSLAEVFAMFASELVADGASAR